MNANITYIQDENKNTIYRLPVSQLNDYILTVEEQQYIDNLTDETNTIISTLKLNASTKAGSSLCTQPYLNTIYARYSDSEFSKSDRNNFKNFMRTKLIGNDIVEFSELSEEDEE